MPTCTFGDPDGSVDIALIGNSHAGHWLPALQPIAERKGWRITTFLASECTATRTPVLWENEELTTSCLNWADAVLDATRSGDFDLVVTAERNGRPALGYEVEESAPHWEAGYREYLQAWAASGVQVLVVHDTPLPARTVPNVPDCLSQREDDLTRCAGDRSAWVPDDALYAAALSIADPRIRTVDLTDYICGPDTCDAAVGGVTVYFDGSHVTATYMGTLAPFILPALEDALAAARRPGYLPLAAASPRTS
jgi:hypothetical protein